jgi:gluconokinase
MIVLLMGVSGSGKTTIGNLLADTLRWRFYDGDDFHPAANVQKMSSGIPLDDDDRQPWLNALNTLMRECNERNESAVVACSALKNSYREILAKEINDLHFVYLKGDYELIVQRLHSRKGHFMKPGMLRSQFDALEEPGTGVMIEIDAPPHDVVSMIRKALGV